MDRSTRSTQLYVLHSVLCRWLMRCYKLVPIITGCINLLLMHKKVKTKNEIGKMYHLQRLIKLILTAQIVEQFSQQASIRTLVLVYLAPLSSRANCNCCKHTDSDMTHSSHCNTQHTDSDMTHSSHCNTQHTDSDVTQFPL
jgi:hypothetical protein